MAVVGGGIAGLATAFSLQEKATEAGMLLTCTLIEAAPEWGGKIATHRVGELVIEAGPDSFLSQKPWGLELCAKLGLSDRLLNTNEFEQKTYVFSRGRLRELPEGLVVVVPTKIGTLLRSGLLSWLGLARMAMELFIPVRPTSDDESLAAFFRRRLGREAFERLIEPLVAGIYAGDADQMSLKATFPRFLEMERGHGSLIRGMLAARAAARPSDKSGRPRRTTFVTLRGGLSELVQALVARIQRTGGILMPGQRVMALKVHRGGNGAWTYELILEHGETVSAEAVVLATPAYVAADLIRPLSPSAARLLAAIPYNSTATVSLAYKPVGRSPSLRGFGFVVPRVEGRDLIAATWSSSKWAYRAPPAQTLIRCYIGGAGREAILEADDETVVRRVREDLRQMAGIEEEPSYVAVNRWERGMPQYTVGHLERLEQIQASLSEWGGLYLTGAGYRGIGIPDCIRDAQETAAMVLHYLAKPCP